MSDLPTWERPHYSPGGGDAYLFYVVYGNIVQSRALSSEDYRCEGVPEALHMAKYNADANQEVVDSFREGYVWEQLQKDSPTLAKTVSAQDACLVIRGPVEDPADLNYLRDTIGLITYFLDCGGVCVHDPQTLRWFSPEEWRDLYFEPETFTPFDHCVILVSEEEEEGAEGLWYHTRGLRKFGRPDLSLHHVPEQLESPVTDLFNRFIDAQARGHVIENGAQIRMKSLPKGLRCYLKGTLDDLDFNNVHVEIKWPK